MAKRAANRAQQQQTAQNRRKALADKAAAAPNDEPEVLPEPTDEPTEPNYERTPEVTQFWESAGIEPIEIALPGGKVGFTLRHYRTAMFYPTPVVESEADPDALDAEFDDDFELPETVQVPDDEPNTSKKHRGEKLGDPQKDTANAPADPTEEPGEPDAADFVDEPGKELVGEEREEAVLLAGDGELHLFRTARGLVTFAASDAAHDLADIDAFQQIKQKLRPELIAPADEDRYELDLVVRNLRGGRDVWDAELLVSAAEVARDAAYACGLTETLEVFAVGSPLDTLDDALRDGGFWARRRLRRLKPEQVALAWRGVIGKIAGAIHWHD